MNYDNYTKKQSKIEECFRAYANIAGGRKRATIVLFSVFTAILVVPISSLYLLQRIFSLTLNELFPIITYEGYVETYVLVLIMLVCSLSWLVFLMMMFYRMEVNDLFRSLATVKNYDRLLAFTFAVCVILLLDSRFHVFDNISHRMSSWAREETIETAAIPLEKLRHAEDFAFGFQIVVEGAVRPSNFHASPRISDSGRILFDPRFDTLVFVRSEQEAMGFPDNVVVAWPDVGQQRLEERLEMLNREIAIDEHALTLGGAAEPSRPVLGEGKLHEKFGLTYPITPEDLVDHWEQVNELIEFLYMRTVWMER